MRLYCSSSNLSQERNKMLGYELNGLHDNSSNLQVISRIRLTNMVLRRFVAPLTGHHCILHSTAQLLRCSNYICYSPKNQPCSSKGMPSSIHSLALKTLYWILAILGELATATPSARQSVPSVRAATFTMAVAMAVLVSMSASNLVRKLENTFRHSPSVIGSASPHQKIWSYFS